MDGKDYYQILGVQRSASSGEIRRRYLALAKAHHPDHAGDTQQMMLLNAAYETLSNPQARFLYNNQLDDQEKTTAVEMASASAAPAASAVYQYDDGTPYAYNAAENRRRARQRPAEQRGRRAERRSWAGRIMSFMTVMAAIVIVGATVAGHLPKTRAMSALTISPSTSGASNSDGADNNTPSSVANAGTDTGTGVGGGPAAASTSASAGQASLQTGSAHTNADPEMPVDGTLQPTTPAETHYRCTLHYIASYKRMNCN